MNKDTQTITTHFEILCHTKDILVVQTYGANDLESPQSQAVDNDTPSYGNFNLGLHVGDNPANVLANRAHLLAQLNQYLAVSDISDDNIDSSIVNQLVVNQRVVNQLVVNQSTANRSIANRNIATPSIRRIHWLNQIHSNQVIDIDNGHQQSPLLTLAPPDADAQITNKVGQALAVMTADCVPIVLYHPQTKQIAAIHAGWKGLANGVIAQTLNKLTAHRAYQSVKSVLPKDIERQGWQAWIGTCICQNCYEVSIDVVDALLQGCEDVIPNINIDRVRKQAVKPHQTDSNKAWLDLVAITTLQLESFGVKLQAYDGGFQARKQGDCPHNTAALTCSYGNERYYSYRRMTHQQRGATGRMALLIVRLS